MQKKYNRFKKLEIKIIKKTEEERNKDRKREPPQNCKSPMQRQRFITTIKNVTEKKKLKSLTRSHSANKINYNRGEIRRKKEKKIQKNVQNKSKQKNNKCFSESLL